MRKQGCDYKINSKIKTFWTYCIPEGTFNVLWPEINWGINSIRYSQRERARAVRNRQGAPQGLGQLGLISEEGREGEVGEEWLWMFWIFKVRRKALWYDWESKNIGLEIRTWWKSNTHTLIIVLYVQQNSAQAQNSTCKSQCNKNMDRLILNVCSSPNQTGMMVRKVAMYW